MDELKIVESFLTNNPCYKANQKITVKGLMLHSVGCAQPKAEVFVKNWNKASYDRACVHAFIDGNTGTVYQTLPWNMRAWHCGKSGNNTHIGVETCEPALIKYTGGASFTYDAANLPAIQASITKTYNAAVQLFANLCKMYNLDPLADGVIVSHKEGYARGIASNHGDIDHLWSQAKTGYTMTGFREAVAKIVYADTEPEPDKSGTTSGETTPSTGKKYYRVRKSPEDAKSQLGAFTDLKKAQAMADAYPGYNVYDSDFQLVYPIATVPFRFQVTKTDKPLTIYKTPSNSSSKWSATVGPGVFTIVKIQNGSGSKKGYGLLKSYAAHSNGWVNLDSVKHIL